MLLLSLVPLKEERNIYYRHEQKDKKKIQTWQKNNFHNKNKNTVINPSLNIWSVKKKLFILGFKRIEGSAMLDVIWKGIPQNCSWVSNLRLSETRSRIRNSEKILFPGVIIMVIPILNIKISIAFWQLIVNKIMHENTKLIFVKVKDRKNTEWFEERV